MNAKGADPAVHPSRSSRRALDLGVEKRIVEKSGAWFAYGGERLGQGRENAKTYLKQNPHIAAALETKLRVEMGLAPATATE